MRRLGYERCGAQRLYWLTQTAGSAARIYYENMHGPANLGRPPSPTPTRVAAFAEDIAVPASVSRAIRSSAGRSLTKGHFAALEAPDPFVADVRPFSVTSAEDAAKTDACRLPNATEEACSQPHI
jgi:hypothetical protein